MASPSQPPPPSSWVILGSIPRTSDNDLPQEQGADLSLALAAPPRVSLLTVAPRVFIKGAAARAPDNLFPFVLAADPSGLLLLHANQGRAAVEEFLFMRDFVPGYFVLDAASASPSALALPNPGLIEQMARLGLIASPGGGGRYMVAELQPFVGQDQAQLFCFSSDAGNWVKKVVAYPLPARARHLSPNGVVSHHGRLWWIDLSWGLLTCDPFADAPALSFVQLPSGKVLKPGEASGVLDKSRCVRVSAGKLRFVDMYMKPGQTGTRKVSVWSLADPDSTVWNLDQVASFDEIWADGSYTATGLPKETPVLALIHPINPNVVYFFLEGLLFAVDVHALKVLEYGACHLVGPPSDRLATRFFHAWELPRAVSPGATPPPKKKLKPLPDSSNDEVSKDGNNDDRPMAVHGEPDIEDVELSTAEIMAAYIMGTHSKDAQGLRVTRGSTSQLSRHRRLRVTQERKVTNPRSVPTRDEVVKRILHRFHYRKWHLCRVPSRMPRAKKIGALST